FVDNRIEIVVGAPVDTLFVATLSIAEVKIGGKCRTAQVLGGIGSILRSQNFNAAFGLINAPPNGAISRCKTRQR
ncbi:MAG: hypothetical protein RLZZ519_2138, partial [Bacteroidota bacterium]